MRWIFLKSFSDFLLKKSGGYVPARKSLTLALPILVCTFFFAPLSVWALFLPYGSQLLALATENPIAAFAGTDVHKAAEALSATKRGARIVLPYYTEKRTELASVLELTDTLRPLLAAERARRTFVAHPTLARALWYHVRLAYGLRSYERGAHALAAFMRSARESTERGVHFHAGYTTLGHFAHTLDAASNSARWAFSTPQAAWPASEDFRERASSGGRSLSADELTHAEAVRLFARTRSPFLNATTTTPGGLTPPAIVIESSCSIGKKISARAYVGWRDVSRFDHRIEGAWVTPIDDLWFYDASTTPSDFIQGMHEYGARYIYQPMNPYLCADYFSDAAQVLTAWYVLDTIQHLPTPQTPRVAEAFSPLYAHANASNTALTFTVFEEGARAIEQTVQEVGFDGFAQREGRVEALAWLTVAHAIKMKTGYFEYAVGSVNDAISTVRHILERQDIPYHAYLLTRVYPSVTFALAHPTLGGNRSLIEMREDVPLEKFHLQSYARQLRTNIPPESLPSFFKEFRARTKPYFLITETVAP